MDSESERISRIKKLFKKLGGNSDELNIHLVIDGIDYKVTRGDKTVGIRRTHLDDVDDAQSQRNIESQLKRLL